MKRKITEENQAKRMESYENILQSQRMYLRRKNGSVRNEKFYKRDEVKKWSFFTNLAFNYDNDMSFENIPLLKIGNMDIECEYCRALKFRREAPGICCSNGKVKLQAFRDPPKYLKELLDGNNEHSKYFMNNIIAYNNAFSFTSFGTTVILYIFSKF